MAIAAFEIAGVGLRVDLEGADLPPELPARYLGYSAVGSSGLRIRIEVSPVAHTGQDDVVVTSRGAARFLIVGADLECTVDLESGEASARMVPSIYALDALLRVTMSLVLAREGGFLLHSAGLIRDGRAYLLFGPSGVGKTTSVQRADGPIVLSDEVVAIRPHHGVFHAHGTPFSGDLGTPGQPVSGPIAAALRLERSAGPPLERLDPSAAAREFLRCVLCFGGGSEVIDSILTSCLDLARSVPCGRLRLSLATPFWEQLRELG